MSREQGPHAKRGDATVAIAARRRQCDVQVYLDTTEADA